VIGRLFNVIAVLGVATLLAGGGFTGFLFGTGRLTAERLQRIAAVVRGEASPRASPTTAPASQPAGEERTEPASTKPAESPEARHQHVELERLRLERATQDLVARQRLLDQALQRIVVEQERLNGERTAKAAGDRRKQASGAAPDEGFRKELDYVSGLKPAQAKEYIVRIWQRQKADAARLMAAIDDSRGRRILEQFKSPEELQLMTDLLEQVRSQGTEGHANASGTTDGAAAP
jgi:hypothetical protein